MRKDVLIIILAFAMFFLPLVSSANVGVSPATITFKDVLRGGYAQRTLIATIDSEEEVTAQVSARGEIESWLSFSESSFQVSKGNPNQIMISVSPPADTPNGNYTGFVTVKTPHLASGSEGYATGIIMPSLDVYVTVQVTDQELISCQATNFEVASAEEGDDILFYLDILNTGNIKLSPKITFNIWDQSLTSLIKEVESTKNEVSPTKKERLTIRVPSKDLNLGQYWVDVSAIECYATQTLTFDILEVGALRAFGILERIFVNPWADVDDIVPILISFKNAGEKALDAKFSGKIMYNGKVIQLLESDVSLHVPLGEQSNFEFYFTPKKAGRYIISGRVFYDNKRSYEQSAVLNVRKGKTTFGDVMKVIAYIILIGIILVLIAKIHKERKLYLSKSRRFRK